MPHIEMGMFARRDVTPGTVAMVGPIFHCGGTRYFLSVGHALGGPGNRNVSASRGMGYERVGQYLIAATNQHADFALVRLDDDVTVDHAHSQPYPLAAADHPLQPGQIMNGYRFVEGVRATQPATLVMQGNLNAPIGNAADITDSSTYPTRTSVGSQPSQCASPPQTPPIILSRDDR